MWVYGTGIQTRSASHHKKRNFWHVLHVCIDRIDLSNLPHLCITHQHPLALTAECLLWRRSDDLEQIGSYHNMLRVPSQSPRCTCSTQSKNNSFHFMVQWIKWKNNTSALKTKSRFKSLQIFRKILILWITHFKRLFNRKNNNVHIHSSRHWFVKAAMLPPCLEYSG